jgi:hypothetical protein
LVTSQMAKGKKKTESNLWPGFLMGSSCVGWGALLQAGKALRDCEGRSADNSGMIQKLGEKPLVFCILYAIHSWANLPLVTLVTVIELVCLLCTEGYTSKLPGKLFKKIQCRFHTPVPWVSISRDISDWKTPPRNMVFTSLWGWHFSERTSGKERVRDGS